MRIYFDNAATTPLDPEVIAAMTEVMQDAYGNPSSIHAEGRTARTLIEKARRTVAQHLNASIGEIFFTSCGTEANNMALKNAVRDLGVRRIISSPIEHHCVLHSLQRLDQEGKVQVEHVRLLPSGAPDTDHLAELLAQDEPKTMVSFMHANNEVGALTDLAVVSALCREHGALFHTDTVQTVGYYPLDVEATPVSFLAGSAHKFYGPKGVGFLYMNSDNLIQPYIDGGAQERNMRGGTENIYGIVGLAKALDLACTRREAHEAHIRSLREHLVQGIRTHFPDVTFNGDLENGHYKVLSLAFPPSPKAELILFNLDIAGISVSGGSACSSGSNVGSHVIRNLRGDQDDTTTIRVSFSHRNTIAEVDRFLEALREILG
ncbi:MAG: cysteine desulfurase [Lewinella sp.]|nr:cysteine desulfurase [Lewinella sp.]